MKDLVSYMFTYMIYSVMVLIESLVSATDEKSVHRNSKEKSYTMAIVCSSFNVIPYSEDEDLEL